MRKPSTKLGQGLRAGAGFLALATLGGCSLAPTYHLPTTAAPVSFTELGPWVPAAPAQADAGQQWWQSFGDSELNALEDRLEAENPSLVQAYGRWEESRASLAYARGGAFPQVDAGGDFTRNRQSNTRPLRSASQPNFYGAHNVGGEASYEVDLWGRVRNSIEAARAQSEASADDVAAVRLELEAQLADEVIALHGYDRETALLDEAVKVYAQADKVMHNRFAGGVSDGIDTGRSGAQLADAQAQLAEIRAQRSQTEHAIALLVGVPASVFSLPVRTSKIDPIAPPAVLASGLLERRPDIAAAERRMFAANRIIGVEKAAFFPELTLLGGGGVQSTLFNSLFTAPSLFWSVGPGVTVPLFEGGRLSARVAQARAQWDQATGSYRETVLGAFRDVEDSLSLLHRLDEEVSADTRDIAATSQEEQLSWNRYIKGASDYLDVVIAQTDDLTARRHALAIETEQAQQSVALIKALGGGWHAADNSPMLQTMRREGITNPSTHY